MPDSTSSVSPPDGLRAATPTRPPASASALAAFLRGIERRAFVFALVQCGREREAEAALGRTIHAFHTLAGVSPLSGWPAGFWSLLLAQPELSGGEGGVPELATIGSGPRAALLLRLVAGLDFPHAAQVLGVGEDTYRFALQRALQQLGDAGVSYATLRALRDRLHRQVKTLPGERTQALATLREQALEAPAVPMHTRRASPPTWVPKVLWALLAVLALAFAATFVDRTEPLAPNTSVGLPVEGAAPEAPVGGPVPSDVVMHPDYAQLAHPEDAKVAQDLALLSWLANHPEELEAAMAEDPAADPAVQPAGAANAPGDADAAGASEPPADTPPGTGPAKEADDAR